GKPIENSHVEITEEVNPKFVIGRSKEEVLREFGINECTLRKNRTL
ncbi:hypothetical protein AVEN_159315-2-1, partial [Araneus ventricosus]